MKAQLIITHPGSAHFDEVTAVSPEMAFTHKSRFMTKTKERLGIDDLITLMSKAVISVLEFK